MFIDDSAVATEGETSEDEENYASEMADIESDTPITPVGPPKPKPRPRRVSRRSSNAASTDNKEESDCGRDGRAGAARGASPAAAPSSDDKPVAHAACAAGVRTPSPHGSAASQTPLTPSRRVSILLTPLRLLKSKSQSDS